MASTEKTGPLIVQGDSSILLDVHHPSAEDARADIGPFSELEKSPEHMHTYKITPLSIWNAASAGYSAEDVLVRLSKWSRFDIPENVIYSISDIIERFGKLVLTPVEGEGNRLLLRVEDEAVRTEIEWNRQAMKHLSPAEGGFFVDLLDRGTIKQILIKAGYPIKDEAPLKEGEPLNIELRNRTGDGYDFHVRDYQREAAEIFYGRGKPGNGFGTVVLPCGSGKTIIGLKVMELVKTCTLILAPNTAAVHQWIDEIDDKTNIDREWIGEYTGEKKQIRPITVATYQILTWRADKEGEFPHFGLFHSRPWGLIIYDEVHLLPAPVFRVTAEIQALRRLGLTATLVREDGREKDVFSLVGPKRCDVPWKELEQKGWIAEAVCNEIRLTLPQENKISYATADRRGKFRIAAENPRKLDIARQLIANHREDQILVIGQYINQLKRIAESLDVPIITGKTPNAEREEIYNDFRSGKLQVIVVSKVANFAIDLPDASVGIQVSGTFGSRQEEAQRLGRILRPKEKNSYFYTLITQHTIEEEYGLNRQKFLTEQGYKYHIEMWDG
ncbi:MAG: DNA repair helicase XPB [Spirochaetaceae bacterium]